MRGTVRLTAILALALSPNLISAQTTTPEIIPGGILSAAGFASEPSNVAAPGGLVTIFGRNLANTTATASGVPLPRELNATAVQMGDVFAPLLFISPTQINAQVPLEILPGSTVNVVVWVSGRSSAPEPLRVEFAAPGIFTVSGNGIGAAVVFHAADGTLVTGSSLAIPGEEVLILCTGLGLTFTSATAPPLVSGGVGNGQPTLVVPAVKIGGTDAVVSANVAAPGRVGQYLIRAVVPNAPPGDQPLVVAIGGRTTQAPVFMSVGNPFAQPGGPQVPPPTIFAGGIINAASLAPAPGNKASPGGLISIFGTTLATTTTEAGGAPLPLSLSGTSVLIGNLSAPLLLVSPTQINAQIPFEIQPGTTANVVVAVTGRASAPEPLQVAAAAPGIFTVSGSGSGPARILHANGTPVTNASPAIPGEEVTIFAAGLGATLATGSLPAVKTGEAGAGQLNLLSPTATIGGKASRVTSSAAAADLVGQYRVKVIVPDVPAGDQEVILTSASNASRASVSLRVGFLFAQPPAFLQLHLVGSFAAAFLLKVKSPDPTDSTKEVDEIATFLKTIPAPLCTIDVAGTTGPTYSALVHCQDYSNPNSLMAIIMGLKDGKFADNKLVFTTVLDSTINHFFFLGQGATPTRTVNLYADGPITDGAVSIDLKRPDFSGGDTNIVGTLRATIKLDASDQIPGGTIILGGSFVDTITSVLPPRLTVSQAGTGAGAITSSPSGIDCGTTCRATYANGTTVTLTAVAAAGSVFSGWSGCDSTSGNTCTVTLTGSRTVTATFLGPTTLTVSKAGTGSGTVTSSPTGINCGSSCQATYTSGATVTLTAVAATGSVFSGWSGCDSTSGNTCTVTLTGSRTVTSTFN